MVSDLSTCKCLVQAMLAKTISSICHKGHFVVKGLF